MTSRSPMMLRSALSPSGAGASWTRAGVLAVIATLVATVLSMALSTPVRANGGPVTGVDGTPMRLEFLIEGARCRTTVLLGSPSLDGEPEPRVRVKWPDGHVNDVTTPVFRARDLADCVNNQGLRVVEIWPLYADAGGSDTGPWLPLYGADVEGDNGSWTLNSLGQTAAEDDSDIARLTRVLQWGELGTTSLRNAFNRHHALIDVPDTLPPGVTDTSYMFRRATAFDDAGIASWNMTTVRATLSMFEDATSFNQPLAGWERAGSTLANVVNFSSMFKNAAAFDQDISTWNVSSADNMRDMFEDATSFNQPLAGWERAGSTLANVVDVDNMFEGATAFDQPIGNWDVSSVTLFSDMFKEAAAFNRDISTWDVSSAVDMNDMFERATSFNQPLAGWERTESTLANVTRLDGMFYDATAFNQDISGWNVSLVDDMGEMFKEATAFDQDISGWNVSSVTDMVEMFRDATSFDRSLGAWTLNATVDLGSMLDDSGMSSSCYDATLIGWAALDPAVSGRSLDAAGREYSPDSAAARAVLVGDRGWTIRRDTTVAVATGRCADDGDLGGGTDPVSGGAATPTLDCTPTDPAVGATVTCTVTGGDADIEVLWRAMAGGDPIAGSGVRLAGDGTGSFSFVASRSALGLPLAVELVEWTRPLALGTVGGPVPAGVPAGEGQPMDGVLPLGLAAALTGLVVGAQRLGRRRMLQRR